MKEQIDYNILRKFATGKYSFREFKLVCQWFEDKKHKPELKNAIRTHWDEFSSDSAKNEKNLDQVLSNLRQKIADQKPVVSLQSRLQKIYLRAAAILLIPLLIYSALSTFRQFNDSSVQTTVEIYSPQGARTHFELPDGSQGWLNGGSKLKYASDFTNRRSIGLVGEAWFDVRKNPSRPFTVQTAALEVKVLGTKFNVSAYPEEKIVDVVLQEGKVKVEGNAQQFVAEIKPDEKFTYDKSTRSTNIQTVNARQYSAWKDGYLVFRNEPLSEVLKRVGRWYNVDFNLDDQELKKFRYRATFHEEQVEEVIRLISLTAPIEYSFDSREIGNDGIFKKRTITIRKKKS